MFGIVLIWFVKLWIIYRLLQQTSKIYSLDWAGQKYSQLKMVKFPARRGSAKLSQPPQAWKPSKEPSFGFRIWRIISVLSTLILTVACNAQARHSSYDGDRTVSWLVKIWSSHQELLLHWSVSPTGSSKCPLPASQRWERCLASNWQLNPQPWLLITEPRAGNAPKPQTIRKK